MPALLFHMVGGAPDPVAPFSHAVEADGWVFVTGQMPFTEARWRRGPKGGEQTPIAPEADTASSRSNEPFKEAEANDSPYPESIEDQTHQVMKNLRAVLEGCHLSLDNVVAARVYLRHFDEDYARMNAVYASYFAPGRLPARTCIGVSGLARGARVEIDLVARR